MKTNCLDVSLGLIWQTRNYVTAIVCYTAYGETSFKLRGLSQTDPGGREMSIISEPPDRQNGPPPPPLALSPLPSSFHTKLFFHSRPISQENIYVPLPEPSRQCCKCEWH